MYKTLLKKLCDLAERLSSEYESPDFFHKTLESLRREFFELKKEVVTSHNLTIKELENLSIKINLIESMLTDIDQLRRENIIQFFTQR